MMRNRLLLLTPFLFAACNTSGGPDDLAVSASWTDELPDADCPIPGGIPANGLIHKNEKHFKNLWRLTGDGENAEAYWSPDGDRLVFQRRYDGVDCDRIFVTGQDGTIQNQISDGKGTTTCSYFLPGGQQVLFGSTGAVHDTCPPKPDMSMGYTWAVYSEFDIYIQDLATGETRPLIAGPGYDTEATVSPTGDSIVFTSSRSGDMELYTCDIDGTNIQQVTDAVGYDGGAFFSHDGEWLVFRTTQFETDELEMEHERYFKLLGNDLIRPHSMEIMLIRPDGSERTQVTHLGHANWAPYFFPNDDRILFCTNHHTTDGTTSMDFDLFAIDVDGSNLERITFDDQFDSFPMFSPDGRYLAFSSNRGGAKKGDTNLFIAEWQ